MNDDQMIELTPSNPPTIFALSSAAGKAGVSIIRVSGAKSWDSCATLLKQAKLPIARQTKLATLYNPDTGQAIDSAMIIGFKAPNSFTGEDVVEYHCHGSQAIIEEMLEVLSAQDGHRLADHGEFTRRAFQNGQIDLSQAEAIADLIDAETKMQKEQALLQMGGALSDLYHDWAARLTKALAYVETIIDFPDEDIPDSQIAQAKPAVKALNAEITGYLNDNRKGERLRSGIQIALIGAPNAGKSSLINILAKRDVAIVSEMAGTTRDVLEVHLNLGGYPVIVSDTAGLRPSDIGTSDQDKIESEGMRRALVKANEADIKLLILDASNDMAHKETLELLDDNAVILINKIDAIETDIDLFHVKQDVPSFKISITQNLNIEDFLDNLTKIIAQRFHVSRETPNLTRNRHRQHLNECVSSIETALTQSQPELMAQDLRFAVNALGRITGRVDVEDLLDVIFKDFCIGK